MRLTGCAELPIRLDVHRHGLAVRAGPSAGPEARSGTGWVELVGRERVKRRLRRVHRHVSRSGSRRSGGSKCSRSLGRYHVERSARVLSRVLGSLAVASPLSDKNTLQNVARQLPLGFLCSLVRL